jgi:hypothetical protein
MDYLSLFKPTNFVLNILYVNKCKHGDIIRKSLKVATILGNESLG